MTDTDTFDSADGVVERDALLFRAGSYPDKDIDVTEEDLDRMVESFEPAPIKVEHMDTPLRFGVVTRIWRKGRELFGRLAFNPLAWALARECGATRLSVAVRRDKTGLREVSLVRSPRIADAAVFSREAEYFAGEDLAGAASETPPQPSPERRGGGRSEGVESLELRVERGEGGEFMETKSEDAGLAAVGFAARTAELERQLRAKDVDAEIDELKRKGKLAPAAEAFARLLLMAADDQVVTFADPATGAESKESVAKTFAAFLDAQPKVIEFAELTPGSPDEKPEFTAQDERLFEKLGVNAETVARHSRRSED